ncbi:MAG: hypothetical protein JNL79_09305 [Myxococcales bacterium]|nr:hypothetical protein [Myxococcales bacterium]
MSVRATVRSGRLIVDEATDLPDGIVLDLVIDDEGDELDPEERAALNGAISRSLLAETTGRSAPADILLDRLRAHRRP